MENEILENAYKVKTAGFEGPFGLLLSLIEERKLFINDLSLASVTEDYIQYVNSLAERNPGEISSFVVVAATLILIKSKSLLPGLALTEEEKTDIKSLEDRLQQYELYTRLAGHIKNNFGKHIIFSPLERKNEAVIFLPDDRIAPRQMMEFAREALGRMPKKTFLPQVEVKKVMSIEEMIGKLTDRIQDAMKISFRDFAGGAKTKEERVFVIVGFLAMLELVRQGVLAVAQENNFEDILIEKQQIITVQSE